MGIKVDAKNIELQDYFNLALGFDILGKFDSFDSQLLMMPQFQKIVASSCYFEEAYSRLVTQYYLDPYLSESNLIRIIGEYNTFTKVYGSTYGSKIINIYDLDQCQKGCSVPLVATFILVANYKEIFVYKSTLISSCIGNIYRHNLLTGFEQRVSENNCDIKVILKGCILYFLSVIFELQIYNLDTNTLTNTHICCDNFFLNDTLLVCQTTENIVNIYSVGDLELIASKRIAERIILVSEDTIFAEDPFEGYTVSLTLGMVLKAKILLRNSIRERVFFYDNKLFLQYFMDIKFAQYDLLAFNKDTLDLVDKFEDVVYSRNAYVVGDELIYKNTGNRLVTLNLRTRRLIKTESFMITIIVTQ
jgi:hypothetical protein